LFHLISLLTRKGTSKFPDYRPFARHFSAFALLFGAKAQFWRKNFEKPQKNLYFAPDKVFFI